MARIRSIKPEFWSDRRIASLSRDARLLYVALWNQADEHGRCQGDTRWVKGHCLPYDDDLNLAAIDRLLTELASAGRVIRYESEGDPYLFLPKLGSHQRLEPQKVASKLPEPPEKTSPQVTGSAQIFSDESARRSDESGAIVALHVAGSMEPVAGTREHVCDDESPRDKSGRAADPIWDALMAACQIDTGSLTAAARGSYNSARKQLADVGATPDEINQRAANYRSHFPNAPLTPPALAKQWAQCATAATQRGRPSTTDAAVNNALALAAKYAQEEL